MTTDYEALAQRLDPERLLDNAACATQNRELLRDDNTGEESQLRMLIRLNVYDPMAAALRELVRERDSMLETLRLYTSPEWEVALRKECDQLRAEVERMKEKP